MAEIKSKVINEAFSEGFDRIYGAKEPHTNRRQRLVYRPEHPLANERGFVDAALVHLDNSSQIQINVDRQYENLQLQDGTLINSRRQYLQYAKEHNVTPAVDYKETWAKAKIEREKVSRGDFDHKERREDLGRANYKITGGL